MVENASLGKGKAVGTGRKRLLRLLLLLLCLISLPMFASSTHRTVANWLARSGGTHRLGKLEPPSGCYIGAFLGFTPQEVTAISEFEGAVGKKHASYLTYSGYGQPFPSDVVEKMKAQGAVPCLAWEPNGYQYANSVLEMMKKEGLPNPPVFGGGGEKTAIPEELMKVIERRGGLSPQLAAKVREFREIPRAVLDQMTHRGSLTAEELKEARQYMKNGLDYVRDDWYLHYWAGEAARCGTPIFLRFASEMNGDWTAYNGDPELFREKWRLVHDVMAKEAPNVAMVWTVFGHPWLTEMRRYYPGDDYVDWVGINIYMVHHHSGKINRPGYNEDPRDFVHLVYDDWAPRKPIQISEYATAHYCQTCNGNYFDFAEMRMREMYEALPRLFPRVKAIYWFNADAASVGKAESDYNVTKYPQLLKAYQECVASPYYLSNVVGSGTGY